MGLMNAVASYVNVNRLRALAGGGGGLGLSPCAVTPWMATGIAARSVLNRRWHLRLGKSCPERRPHQLRLTASRSGC